MFVLKVTAPNGTSVLAGVLLGAVRARVDLLTGDGIVKGLRRYIGESKAGFDG